MTEQYIIMRNSIIEKALITRLEILLGRVPSNQEVKTHGMRKIYPDNREEYLWDDHIVLEVMPPKFL